MSPPSCDLCGRRFGLIVWRHPCRGCGKTLCVRCSDKSQLCPDCSLAQSPHQSARYPTPASPISPGSTAPATPQPVETPLLPEPAETYTPDALRQWGRVSVGILEARGLVKADRNVVGTATSSDPYVVVELRSQAVSSGHPKQGDEQGQGTRRTRTMKNTVSPVWGERFLFETEEPGQWVHVEVWDEDVAARDDKLGETELCLEACARDRRYEGWLELKGGKAGMVRVEVKVETSRGSEIVANFRAQWRQMYESPRPAPAFNVDELYGPAMVLQEILGTRLIFPIANKVGALVLWESTTQSTLAVAVWGVLARNFRFWPTLFCWGVATVMYFNPPKRRKPEISSKPNKSEAGTPTESQSLGGFVNFVARAMPGSLKDTLRNFQVPLRAASDGVCQAYDALHWHSRLSLPLFRGLLAAGAVLLVLPFWVVVLTVGLVVLLAFSPLAVAFKAALALGRGAKLRDTLYLEPEFDPSKAALWIFILTCLSFIQFISCYHLDICI